MQADFLSLLLFFDSGRLGKIMNVKKGLEFLVEIVVEVVVKVVSLYLNMMLYEVVVSVQW